MRKSHYLFIIVLQILWFNQAMAEKEVVGWVETARIYPGGIELRAKIDTGAETTSLNCNCIQYTDHDGEKWVRFTIKNHVGNSLEIEKKIQRIAIIKRHYGESQERPVINLGICLSGTYRETEVNLVDRSGMNYQLLIGRYFLQDHFIVDPATTYTKAPNCSTTGISK